MDVFRKGKSELFGLTETKLKGNATAPMKELMKKGRGFGMTWIA